MMPHAMAHVSCAGSMISDRRCGRRPARRWTPQPANITCNLVAQSAPEVCPTHRPMRAAAHRPQEETVS
jgi:hypothetical protein